MPFEMHYGALWDIKEQLEEQGLELILPDLDYANTAHDALNWLYIQGFITAKEYNRGIEKLHRWIRQRIQKK